MKLLTEKRELDDQFWCRYPERRRLGAMFDFGYQLLLRCVLVLSKGCYFTYLDKFRFSVVFSFDIIFYRCYNFSSMCQK